MVRMTNTYLLGGEGDPDDIVASTDHGVYVASLGGGQVNTATGDFVFGMTEAYLIEDGEITEPIREGNLIGNGPKVLLDIDAVGNDFAMGHPGTCGKDGQGVPGRRRRPHPAGQGAHRRRHRGTERSADPGSLFRGSGASRVNQGDTSERPARRRRPVVGMAEGGEQLEAYVGAVDATPRCASTRARSSSWRWPTRWASACGWCATAARASPTAAPSTPRRWPRRWPRPATTPPSASPTRAGLAEPDGVEPRPRPLGDRPGRRAPPTTRWRWRSSSSGRCWPPTPASPASSRATTATRWPRPRSSPPPASAARPGRPAASSSPTPWRPTATRPQTGFGFSLGRSFDELDVEGRRARRRRPGVRMLGATQPPSGRLTVVLDPWVTAQLLGIVAGTLGAEEVVKAARCSPTGWASRWRRRCVTLVEDPTDARSWGATPVDAEGLATRRAAHRRRRAAGLRPLDLDRPPHGHGLDRLGGAGGFKSTPAAGCRAVA